MAFTRLRTLCVLALVLLGGSWTSCAAAPSAPRRFSVGGREYVALAEMASFYNLQLAETAGGRVVLSSRYHAMAYEVDSRRVSMMGVELWLEQPLARVRGRWAVARTDADALIDPILRSYRYLGERGARTVVLDPGHGGMDGGAVGPRGVTEKSVVLELARRARTLLRARGLRVVLTRSDDRYVDLYERGRIAARARADLFVSIHLNATGNRRVAGVETFILSKTGQPSTNASDGRPSRRYARQPGNAYDAASAVLGFCLQRRVVERTGTEDRGLRHARFAVLKNAPCPAALVEGAFLSNTRDERRLATPEGREELARGLAEGIADYVNQVLRAQLTASTW